MAAFSYAYWLRTDFGDDPDDDEDLGPKIEADADEAAAPPVPTSSTSDEDPFDPQGEYSQADLVEPGRLPRKKGVARKSPQRPRPEDHADAVDDDDLPLPRAVLEIEDEDGTDD